MFFQLSRLFPLSAKQNREGIIPAVQVGFWWGCPFPGDYDGYHRTLLGNPEEVLEITWDLGWMGVVNPRFRSDMDDSSDIIHRLKQLCITLV